MIFHYYDDKLDGRLALAIEEEIPADIFEDYPSTLTVLWNRGNDRDIMVDGIKYQFTSQSVLPLVMNQDYALNDVEDIVSWKFNREFYCVMDHDKEVSCAGLLFYNSNPVHFIPLSEDELRKLNLLLNVFEEEYSTKDSVQGEMLRILLKRLIIKLTRYIREEFEGVGNNDIDLVKSFNMMVEKFFKSKHQVQDYADLLNKSPKTLSNAFSKYGERSPIQIIHNRLFTEAKRLLSLTDKSSKEISFELGFNEVQHFSRFFKKMASMSPSEFKEVGIIGKSGKN